MNDDREPDIEPLSAAPRPSRGPIVEGVTWGPKHLAIGFFAVLSLLFFFQAILVLPAVAIYDENATETLAAGAACRRVPSPATRSASVVFPSSGFCARWAAATCSAGAPSWPTR